MPRASRVGWVFVALAGCGPALPSGPSTTTDPTEDLQGPDVPSNDSDTREDSDPRPDTDAPADTAPRVDTDAPAETDSGADTDAPAETDLGADTDPRVDTDLIGDTADTDAPDTDTAAPDTYAQETGGGPCELPTAYGYETDVPELTWAERIANHCDHSRGYWVCDEEIGTCTDGGVLYDVAVPQPATVPVYGFYDHTTGALVSRWVGSDTWEFCRRRTNHAWVPVELPGCAPRYVIAGRWTP